MKKLFCSVLLVAIASLSHAENLSGSSNQLSYGVTELHGFNWINVSEIKITRDIHTDTLRGVLFYYDREMALFAYTDDLDAHEQFLIDFRQIATTDSSKIIGFANPDHGKYHRYLISNTRLIESLLEFDPHAESAGGYIKQMLGISN